MIPKVIHYCWFGRGQMPAIAKVCISSWEKYLPNYELRLWNEDTFDVNSVPYVKEAYEARKFAFVTDYVRLYAIYYFGGIYVDTDVEMLKKLDNLLHLPAFSGFESDKDIPTGIMASERHGLWAKEQLRYYDGRHFKKKSGGLDITTNVEIISGLMAANGFKLDNTYQVYKEYMHIFPSDFFCPKSRSGKIYLTPNTYCIHHFAGSWQPASIKAKRFFFRSILGSKLTEILIQFKKDIFLKKR